MEHDGNYFFKISGNKEETVFPKHDIRTLEKDIGFTKEQAHEISALIHNDDNRMNTLTLYSLDQSDAKKKHKDEKDKTQNTKGLKIEVNSDLESD